jgi:hypothetical protein
MADRKRSGRGRDKSPNNVLDTVVVSYRQTVLGY